MDSGAIARENGARRADNLGFAGQLHEGKRLLDERKIFLERLGSANVLKDVANC
jgi:hypothetical protein